MRSHLIATVSVLALGCLAGTVQAAEPISKPASSGQPIPATTAPGQVVSVPAQTGTVIASGPVVSMPAAGSCTGLRECPFPAGCAPCDACDQCCFCVDVGLYYMQPFWKTNGAYVIERQTEGQPSGQINEFTRQEDFDYDFEFAPVIAIEYKCGHGLGVRGRYWHFDAGDTVSAINHAGDNVRIRSAHPLGDGVESPTPIPPGFVTLGDGTGDRLVVESGLELDVFDVELTKACDFCGCSVLFFGGVRFARIDQTFNGFVANRDLTFTEINLTDHVFNGAGPTLGMEVRHMLGCTGLALFGSGRGSFLYGHHSHHMNSFEVLEARGVRFNPGEFDTSSVEWQDFLPVLEAELGVEWASNACDGCSLLFVQAALVGQAWLGAGNSSLNEIINIDRSPNEVADADANLGFFGFRVSVGVCR